MGVGVFGVVRVGYIGGSGVGLGKLGGQGC